VRLITLCFIACVGLLADGLPAAGASATPDGDASLPSFDPYLISFERSPSAAEMTRLGRQMFFDARLSASGKMACATCHDPKFAYGPPNDKPVQMGGANGRQAGVRAVPSLRYRESMPTFTEHYHEGEDTNGDQGPTGGLTWDGRSASARDQARVPLFSSYEMGNPSASALVEKIRQADYAGQVREAFGPHALDDQRRVLAVVLLSLEVFQQDPHEFYPFDSKYDAFLRGQTKLSAKEMRGLEVFENPKKGNCALCHPNSTLEGAFPMFTDNGYIALGVPRNPHIAANQDPKYFDLGLCGPYRLDLHDHQEYCGMFRTPSLRNVAMRRTFFHNGEMHTLKDAVAFYAQRDTQPKRWYRAGRIDDLPARYSANLDREAPFGGKPGDPDSLDAAEIDDLIAFLGTLTDGYQVKMPERDVAGK
jgi:cytochrome c peroxidase